MMPLSQLYKSGRGVSSDPAAALDFYRQALEAGHSDAGLEVRRIEAQLGGRGLRAERLAPRARGRRDQIRPPACDRSQPVEEPHPARQQHAVEVELLGRGGTRALSQGIQLATLIERLKMRSASAFESKEIDGRFHSSPSRSTSSTGAVAETTIRQPQAMASMSDQESTNGYVR